MRWLNSLIFLFSLLCLKSIGGERKTLFTSTLTTDPDSLKVDNEFAVKIAPLSAINIFDGVSLNLGIEKKLHMNYSLCVNGGPYFSYYKNGIGSGSSGYFVNPEIRKYLNKNGRTEGKYLSFDYKYKDNSFNWTDSFLVDGSNGVRLRYEKDYRIRTVAHSFNLKFGGTILEKQVIVDCFIGGGIKIRHTTTTLTKQEEDGLLDADKYSTFQNYRSTWGDYIWPNFTIGIKIGWYK